MAMTQIRAVQRKAEVLTQEPREAVLRAVLREAEATHPVATLREAEVTTDPMI